MFVGPHNLEFRPGPRYSAGHYVPEIFTFCINRARDTENFNKERRDKAVRVRSTLNNRRRGERSRDNWSPGV